MDKNHGIFAKKIRQYGGRLWYVGGAVRDELLGVKHSDYDFVVFGFDGIDELQNVLCEFGDVAVAGTEFAIVKLRVDGIEYDFALARREHQSGGGYRDVVVDTSGVSIDEDARRRDLTVNAIYRDVLSGTLVSPVGGIEDLNNRVFRHSSDKFAESSERPLRLAQFLARYPDFSVVPETVAICHSMLHKFDSIPKEQLRQQFYKLLTGKKPSVGLMFLRYIGWLQKFPALYNMIGVVQEPKHHPEGDVFTHTMMVVDSMARMCDDVGITGTQRFKLVLAALVHDTGKVGTTKLHDGKIVAYGHQKNLSAASDFLAQIDVPKRVTKAVLTLVRYHMRRRGLKTRKAVRRLSRKLWDTVRTDDVRYSASMWELCLLMTADVIGRGVDSASAILEIDNILEMARQESAEVAAPPRIVTGYDIMDAFGLTKKDGLKIGQMLRIVNDAVDDGLVTTKCEAIKYLKTVNE